jgi:hypothetical protein
MIKTILTLGFLVYCFSAQAGNMSEDKAVLDPANEGDKKQLITEVAALMGQTVDPNDPKALQAAEAFLVADAAKAYAFTKIHAVPLEFCPDNTALVNALAAYKTAAKGIIALGQHYYAHGIDLMIGEKHISNTSQALNDGLIEMLEGSRKEFKGVDREAIETKCNESVEALRMLVQLYGG